MFALARRATKAGKTSLEPAAREELHDRLRHYVTQRPRAGLEALLVGCDILLEVLLERLVENGGFGMPRTVNGRRFASQNARIRCGAMAVLDSNVLQKTRRLGVTGHWPRPSSGSGAATDLTVHDSSEPSFRARAGHYLVETHPLFYAPSLTALREMMKSQLVTHSAEAGNGLKILSSARSVRVRVPPSAPIKSIT